MQFKTILPRRLAKALILSTCLSLTLTAFAKDEAPEELQDLCENVWLKDRNDSIYIPLAKLIEILKSPKLSIGFKAANRYNEQYLASTEMPLGELLTNEVRGAALQQRDQTRFFDGTGMWFVVSYRNKITKLRENFRVNAIFNTSDNSLKVVDVVPANQAALEAYLKVVRGIGMASGRVAYYEIPKIRGIGTLEVTPYNMDKIINRHGLSIEEDVLYALRGRVTVMPYLDRGMIVHDAFVVESKNKQGRKIRIGITKRTTREKGEVWEMKTAMFPSPR